jgi:hypothetical protein
MLGRHRLEIRDTALNMAKELAGFIETMKPWGSAMGFT